MDDQEPRKAGKPTQSDRETFAKAAIGFARIIEKDNPLYFIDKIGLLKKREDGSFSPIVNGNEVSNGPVYICFKDRLNLSENHPLAGQHEDLFGLKIEKFLDANVKATNTFNRTYKEKPEVTGGEVVVDKNLIYVDVTHLRDAPKAGLAAVQQHGRRNVIKAIVGTVSAGVAVDGFRRIITKGGESPVEGAIGVAEAGTGTSVATSALGPSALKYAASKALDNITSTQIDKPENWANFTEKLSEQLDIDVLALKNALPARGGK